MILARLISEKRGFEKGFENEAVYAAWKTEQVEGYCLPDRQPENQVFRSIQDGFEEDMSKEATKGQLSGKAVF